MSKSPTGAPKRVAVGLLAVPQAVAAESAQDVALRYAAASAQTLGVTQADVADLVVAAAVELHHQPVAAVHDGAVAATFGLEELDLHDSFGHRAGRMGPRADKVSLVWWRAMNPE